MLVVPYRHVSAPKSLKDVLNKNIFFGCKMKHLSGAKTRVAEI